MSKQWVPFNSNGYVRVRLTDKGREVIRRDIRRLKGHAPHINWKYLMPTEDAEGRSEWQLWQLMERFGNYVGNGEDLVFETDIEISLDLNSPKPKE